MLRFILIILLTLFFGIPYLYEQAIATETKIIELNGKEWLVSIEPGKEPMFKPLEASRSKITKLPFVIHGETPKSTTSSLPLNVPVEHPEWQRKTVKESKLVQVCDDPMGCEMTIEGDCPDCKTELIREETVEVVQKSDFTEFKESVKAHQLLNEKIKNRPKVKHYLQPWVWMRDTGHPLWICRKVSKTCAKGDPISIEDLYLAKLSASKCSDYHGFDWTRPLNSCHKSPILNLK